jgi:hypothetical protein
VSLRDLPKTIKYAILSPKWRGMMKIDKRSVKVFKIRNRKGYAALFCNNLTEGRTPDQAFARMAKATRRKCKK